MSENPVIHLFDASYEGWARRYQQKSPRWARWYAYAMVAYLGLGFLSSVGMTSLNFGALAGLAVLLGEVAALGLLLIPLSAGGSVYMALQSVRQGRCLEEIMTAGISAPRIVDGFVLASLRRLARWIVGGWLLVLVGSLCLTRYGPWALLAAALWLPAVTLLAVSAAYLWGRLAVVQGFGQVSHFFANITLVVALAAIVATTPPEWAACAFLAALVACPLMASWLARRQTIAQLIAAEPVRRTVARPAAGPLPEGNPLVIRETMRRLSWSSWARNWDACLSLGLAVVYGLAACAEPSTDAAAPLLVFWWALAFLAPFRAAFRSLEVFQADRQAGSLESLLTTRLSVREAVEGAARLGWERPLRELLVVGVVFLPLGFGLECQQYGNLDFLLRFVGAVGGTLLLAAFGLVVLFGASYLGVAAGLRSGSRQEAWVKLFGWAFQSYCTFWLACMGAVLCALPFGQTGPPVACGVAGIVVFTLGPCVFWRWSRSVAYGKARHNAQEPGFA